MKTTQKRWGAGGRSPDVAVEFDEDLGGHLDCERRPEFCGVLPPFLRPPNCVPLSGD